MKFNILKNKILIYVFILILIFNNLYATNVININTGDNNKSIESEADIKKQLHEYKTVSKWIIDNKNNFTKVLNETAKKSKTKWIVEYNNQDLEKINYKKTSVIDYNTNENFTSDLENCEKDLFHIVKEKETLFSISKKYNTSIQELVILNNLSKNTSIYVGQQLLIKKGKVYNRYSMSPLDSNIENSTFEQGAFVYPKYKFYQVKNGDTIYSISKTVNMTSEELLKFNNLSKVNLYPGMLLKIYANYENFLTNINNNQSDKFEWPLVGRLLISFGPQKSGIVSEGINIMAKKGASVKAVADGVVIYVGNGVKALGNIVLLQHNNGWISIYGYVEDILIKKGDEVKKGQIIAKVGKLDNIKIPQLHFELRQNIVAKDPLEYLNSYT